MSTSTIDDLLREGDWLRGIARALTRDGDDAEDLVQDTLLASLRRPPRDTANPRPWLAAVLRNRLRNQARSRKRAEAALSTVTLAPGEDNERLLARLQMQKLIAELVFALEEPLRQTVLLRYFDGLTSEEIGVRMRVPAGTVRWRLKSALEDLRRRLDERTGDRERWRRVLLPLAIAPALTRPLLRLGPASLAAMAVVVAGGMAVIVSTRPSEVGRTSDRASLLGRATIVAASGVQETAALEGVVQDEAGKRVPGARVLALRLSEDRRFANPGGREPWTVTMTDADGKFRFPRLEAAGYTLTATSPGSSGRAGPIRVSSGRPARAELTVAPRAVVVTGLVGDNDRRPIPGATVRAASVLGEISFLYEVTADELGRFSMRVERSTRIASLLARADGYADERVPLSAADGGQHHELVLLPEVVITGRVVASGKGVPHALVTPLFQKGMLKEPQQSVETDASGAFVLRGLRPGHYRLRARGGGSFGMGPAFEASAGARVSDLTLEISPAGGVRGRVIDVQGRGVPGARLSVMSAQMFELDTIAAGTADESGRFHIDGLPDGRHQVHVGASGYLVGRQEVTIAQPDTAELTVSLAAAVTAAGTVHTPDGAPALGARISTRVRAKPQDHSGNATADASGRFEVRLGTGELHLVVVHPFGAATAGPLQLSSEGLRNLKIALSPGARVSGHVRWDDGAPAVGADVEAAVRGDVQTNIGPVRVAKDGFFEVGPLPSGKVTVFARMPGDRRGFAYDYETPNQATITLTQDERRAGVALVIPRPIHQIAGRVLGADGKPVANARVSAGAERNGIGQKPGNRNNADTLTDAEGRFTLRDLVRGEHTVWVADSAHAELALAHVPAGTRNLVVKLPPAMTIRGRVVDTFGKPVTEYKLLLTDRRVGETEAERQRRQSAFDNRRFEIRDPGGAFAVPSSGAGAIDLHVQAANGERGALLGLRPALASTPPGVIVVGGLTVRGRVVSADGARLFPAQVAVTLPFSSVAGQTDATGAFTITGLPRSLRELQVVAWSRERPGARAKTTVTVAPGAVEVDAGTLTLEPAGP